MIKSRKKALILAVSLLCLLPSCSSNPVVSNLRKPSLKGNNVPSAPSPYQPQKKEELTPPNVLHITTGNHHSCAVLKRGNVRCWGWGKYGRLGYGNTNDIGDNETPASAGDVMVGGKVKQISTGGVHTCALLATGNVRCWGVAESGQLGYGNNSRQRIFGKRFIANRNDIGDDETPASAGDVMVGGKVTQISAGHAHTCALLATGNVRCWGLGDDGQLGYGNTDDIGKYAPPASAGDVMVGGKVTQISAGHAHTCSLLATGNVRCWGDNYYGQLGYGNTNKIGDYETPASAGNVDIGGKVTQISAGSYHTCALLDTGNVRCWGTSDSGQLGYRTTNNIGDDETPASAGDVMVGGKVTQISAGTAHTCALLDTGNVRCWGLGDDGRLGYGNTNNIGDDETPASTGNVDIGGKVTQISAGHAHTCALLETGNVRCWGWGSSGRLGYGNTNNIGDDETPASAGNVIIE
jgi:alpha-tubulin suppressor-like RCC1 family protein